MITVSLEQFARNLLASGLMSVQELAALNQSLPPGQKPKTAEDLGKLLVQHGNITPYQAQMIWRGRL